MKKQSILYLVLLCFLSSCKIGQVMKAIETIENKEVHAKDIHTFDGKNIKLIPLSHIGQAEFYAALKDSIASWKRNGYRMYYEEMNEQSFINEFGKEASDLNVKKWRRIHGGSLANRADFDDLKKQFEGAVTQPEWIEMGIDESDLNADISISIFIREYEKRYDVIELTDCDHTTNIKAEYNCSEEYDNDMKPIIHDFRNQKVIDFINNEGDQKIVVLYGLLHIEPLEKMIKKRKK